MALIRYPGSKERLAKRIIAEIPVELTMPLWVDSNRWEYREPFFGAGAVGFLVLKKWPPSCRVWLNDIDYGLVCLWQAVWNDIERLCQKIEAFTPSIDDFYRFKEEDGQKSLDPIEVGFRKLALHQMSYSGLGFMSGGPLGGKDQDKAEYTVDCRWSRGRLMRHAIRLHKILSEFRELKITCKDFSKLIDDDPKTFLYLDPPYYEKGQDLYRYYMTDDDHRRLARLLKDTRSRWVLSYDDHPFIRQLYHWAEFQELTVKYTAARAMSEKRPKNQEVLISTAT